MGRHSYLDQAGQLAAQVGIQAVQEGHGDKLALVSSFLPMGWVTAHQCCGVHVRQCCLPDRTVARALYVIYNANSCNTISQCSRR